MQDLDMKEKKNAYMCLTTCNADKLDESYVKTRMIVEPARKGSRKVDERKNVSHTDTLGYKGNKLYCSINETEFVPVICFS